MSCFCVHSKILERSSKSLFLSASKTPCCGQSMFSMQLLAAIGTISRKALKKRQASSSICVRQNQGEKKNKAAGRGKNLCR